MTLHFNPGSSRGFLFLPDCLNYIATSDIRLIETGMVFSVKMKLQKMALFQNITALN
jgi:hypothetical protein